MLDRYMRPLIDPPLNAVAHVLTHTPISANGMTVLGMVLGIAAGGAIVQGYFIWALSLIAASRLADGLDGPLARAKGTNSDFGGYLDILCDFVFYAAIPLSFAFHDVDDALPAAVLLASFLLTGVSHLAFAIHAEKRGLETVAQGKKSFFFADGLAEGTETIGVFAAMALFPDHFAAIAYGYAGVCVFSALGRTISAARTFR